MKNHHCCFKLIICFAVHQHTMPKATPKVIFFSLYKLYHHSSFAFTGFLPVVIPHCKLLTLHLKTKHKLPAPISAPTSPSSHPGRLQPTLFQQPFCFCFPAAFYCISSAALYTTYIPFLHGFLQRFFTLSLPFLSLISCWIFFFFILVLMAEKWWIYDK